MHGEIGSELVWADWLDLLNRSSRVQQVDEGLVDELQNLIGAGRELGATVVMQQQQQQQLQQQQLQQQQFQQLEQMLAKDGELIARNHSRKLLSWPDNNPLPSQLDNSPILELEPTLLPWQQASVYGLGGKSPDQGSVLVKLSRNCWDKIQQSGDFFKGYLNLNNLPAGFYVTEEGDGKLPVLHYSQVLEDQLMQGYSDFHHARVALRMAELQGKPEAGSGEFIALVKQVADLERYGFVYRVVVTGDQRPVSARAVDEAVQLIESVVHGYSATQLKVLLGDFAPELVKLAERGKEADVVKLQTIIVTLNRLQVVFGNNYVKFLSLLSKDRELFKVDNWDINWLADLYDLSLISSKSRSYLLSLGEEQSEKTLLDVRAAIANFNWGNHVLDEWYRDLGRDGYFGTDANYCVDMKKREGNWLRDQACRMRLLNDSLDIIEQNEALAKGGCKLLVRVAEQQTKPCCYHALDLYMDDSFNFNPINVCLQQYFTGEREAFAGRHSRRVIEPVMQNVISLIEEVLPVDWLVQTGQYSAGDAAELLGSYCQILIGNLLDDWFLEGTMSLSDKIALFKETLTGALTEAHRQLQILSEDSPAQRVNQVRGAILDAITRTGMTLACMVNREVASHFSGRSSLVELRAVGEELRDLLKSWLASSRNIDQWLDQRGGVKGPYKYDQYVKVEDFNSDQRELWEQSKALLVLCAFFGSDIVTVDRSGKVVNDGLVRLCGDEAIARRVKFYASLKEHAAISGWGQEEYDQRAAVHKEIMSFLAGCDLERMQRLAESANATPKGSVSSDLWSITLVNFNSLGQLLEDLESGNNWNKGINWQDKWETVLREIENNNVLPRRVDAGASILQHNKVPTSLVNGVFKRQYDTLYALLEGLSDEQFGSKLSDAVMQGGNGRSKLLMVTLKTVVNAALAKLRSAFKREHIVRPDDESSLQEMQGYRDSLWDLSCRLLPVARLARGHLSKFVGEQFFKDCGLDEILKDNTLHGVPLDQVSGEQKEEIIFTLLLIVAPVLDHARVNIYQLFGKKVGEMLCNLSCDLDKMWRDVVAPMESFCARNGEISLDDLWNSVTDGKSDQLVNPFTLLRLRRESNAAVIRSTIVEYFQWLTSLSQVFAAYAVFSKNRLWGVGTALTEFITYANRLRANSAQQESILSIYENEGMRPETVPAPHELLASLVGTDGSTVFLQNYDIALIKQACDLAVGIKDNTVSKGLARNYLRDMHSFYHHAVQLGSELMVKENELPNEITYNDLKGAFGAILASGVTYVWPDFNQLDAAKWTEVRTDILRHLDEVVSNFKRDDGPCNMYGYLVALTCQRSQHQTEIQILDHRLQEERQKFNMLAPKNLYQQSVNGLIDIYDKLNGILERCGQTGQGSLAVSTGKIELLDINNSSSPLFEMAEKLADAKEQGGVGEFNELFEEAVVALERYGADLSRLPLSEEEDSRYLSNLMDALRAVRVENIAQNLMVNAREKLGDRLPSDVFDWSYNRQVDGNINAKFNIKFGDWQAMVGGWLAATQEQLTTERAALNGTDDLFDNAPKLLANGPFNKFLQRLYASSLDIGWREQLFRELFKNSDLWQRDIVRSDFQLGDGSRGDYKLRFLMSMVDAGVLPASYHAEWIDKFLTANWSKDKRATVWQFLQLVATDENLNSHLAVSIGEMLADSDSIFNYNKMTHYIAARERMLVDDRKSGMLRIATIRYLTNDPPITDNELFLSELDPFKLRFVEIEAGVQEDRAVLLERLQACETARLIRPDHGNNNQQMLDKIISQFVLTGDQELDNGTLLEVIHHLQVLDQMLNQDMADHLLFDYLTRDQFDSIDFPAKVHTLELLRLKQPIYTLGNQDIRELLQGLGEIVRAVEQLNGLDESSAKVLKQAIFREMLLLLAEVSARATNKYPRWHQLAALVIAFNNSDTNVLEQLVTGGGKTVISHIMVALEHYWGRLPIAVSANADLAFTSCQEFKPFGTLLGLRASQDLADQQADVVFTTGVNYTANKTALFDRNQDVSVIIDEVDTVSLDASHMVKMVEQEDPDADPNVNNPDAYIYERLGEVYATWYRGKGFNTGKVKLTSNDVAQLLSILSCSVSDEMLERILTRIYVNAESNDPAVIRSKKMRQLIISATKAFNMLINEPRNFRFKIDTDGRLSYEIVELGNVQQHSCFEDPIHQMLMVFGVQLINEWLSNPGVRSTRPPFGELDRRQLLHLDRVSLFIGPYTRSVVSALQNQSLIEADLGGMRDLGLQSAIREVRVVGFSGTVKMYGGRSDRRARELYGAKLIEVPMPKQNIDSGALVVTTRPTDTVAGLLQQCAEIISGHARSSAWICTDDRYKVNVLLGEIMHQSPEQLVAVRSLDGYEVYKGGQKIEVLVGKKELFAMMSGDEELIDGFQVTDNKSVIVLSDETLNQMEQVEYSIAHYLQDNEKEWHLRGIGEELTRQIRAQDAKENGYSTYLILREEASEVMETARIVQALPDSQDRYVVVKTGDPVTQASIDSGEAEPGDMQYAVYLNDSEYIRFPQKMLHDQVEALLNSHEVIICSDFSVGRGTDLSMVKNEIIGDLVRDKADVMQMIGRVDRENIGGGRSVQVVTNTSIVRAFNSTEPVQDSDWIVHSAAEKVKERIERYLEQRLRDKAGKITLESVLEYANSLVQQYFDNSLFFLKRRLGVQYQVRADYVEQITTQLFKQIKHELIAELSSLRQDYAGKIGRFETSRQEGFVGLLEDLRGRLTVAGEQALQKAQEKANLTVKQDLMDKWLAVLKDGFAHELTGENGDGYGSGSELIVLLGGQDMMLAKLKDRLMDYCNNHVQISLADLRDETTAFLYTYDSSELRSDDFSILAQIRSSIDNDQRFLDLKEKTGHMLFEAVKKQSLVDAFKSIAEQTLDLFAQQPVAAQTSDVLRAIIGGAINSYMAQQKKTPNWKTLLGYGSTDFNQQEIGLLSNMLYVYAVKCINQEVRSRKERFTVFCNRLLREGSEVVAQYERSSEENVDTIEYDDTQKELLTNHLTELFNQNLLDQSVTSEVAVSVGKFADAWCNDRDVLFAMGRLREEVQLVGLENYVFKQVATVEVDGDPGYVTGRADECRGVEAVESKIGAIINHALVEGSQAMHTAGDYVQLGVGIAGNLPGAVLGSSRCCQAILQVTKTSTEDNGKVAWLRRCTRFGALSYYCRSMADKPSDTDYAISNTEVKELLFGDMNVVNPVAMSRSQKDLILRECVAYILTAMKDALTSGKRESYQTVMQLLEVCDGIPQIELSEDFVKRHGGFTVMMSALNVHRSKSGTPWFLNRPTRTAGLLKSFAARLLPSLQSVNALFETATDQLTDQERFKQALVTQYNRRVDKMLPASQRNEYRVDHANQLIMPQVTSTVIEESEASLIESEGLPEESIDMPT